MIMVNLTTLKKPKLLYVSLTHTTMTFKGNPFLYFQFEDFNDFQLLSSDGIKFQIFARKRIAIQRHGKQSERVVFPKYYSYEDYTNLF